MLYYLFQLQPRDFLASVYSASKGAYRPPQCPRRSTIRFFFYHRVFLLCKCWLARQAIICAIHSSVLHLPLKDVVSFLFYPTTSKTFYNQLQGSSFSLATPEPIDDQVLSPSPLSCRADVGCQGNHSSLFIPFLQWHVRLLAWFNKMKLSDDSTDGLGRKRFEPPYPKTKNDLLQLTALRLDGCNLSGKLTGHFFRFSVWSVPYDQPYFDGFCPLLPQGASPSLSGTSRN